MGAMTGGVGSSAFGVLSKFVFTVFTTGAGTDIGAGAGAGLGAIAPPGSGVFPDLRSSSAALRL